MALILLLETATATCSVALTDNENILAIKEQNERNIHASHITLFIEDVMNSAGKNYKQLDAIAISKGPGSYTGLRIGASTAKGLCYALDIPLIAINTLHAMAYGLLQKHRYSPGTLLCPMIDARRMEVYTALYDTKLLPVLDTQAMILNESSFDVYFEHHPVVFFGDGAEKSKQLFGNHKNAIYTGFENSAVNLNLPASSKFMSAEFEDVSSFEPFYLKDYLVKSPGK